MYRRPRSAGTNEPFKAPRMTIPVEKKADENGSSKPKLEERKPLEATNKSQLPRQPAHSLKRSPFNAELPDIKKVKLSEKVTTEGLTQSSNSTISRYFEVVWRKPTMKKNKSWDGDGIVIVTPTFLSLRLDESSNFKEITKSAKTSKFTTDGVFQLGSLEVESMGEITDQRIITSISEKKQSVPPKPESSTIRPMHRVSSLKARVTEELTMRTPVKKNGLNTQFKRVLPSSEPIISVKSGQPLYDPTAENAIVMKKQSSNDVDVVIDPFIAKLLRPHQVAGVKFLYECVMGLRDNDISGALLADDMGLGKTLQTITLIWMLLKQSPLGFEYPAVSKVLIACPVTLVANWKREFKKWLPMNRINVLTLYSKNTASKDKQDLRNFAKTRVYQVLIMGYEKTLSMREELALSNFDLLVCDEGHRLKNNSNKALHALNSLEIQKKVLLSGTPIQNDLNEFFNIIDFVNPGILGKINQFKKNYINPILRSRELNCTDPDIIQNGEDKSLELINLTKPFILRRTATVISNHLPPRTDIVLFCKPTSQQIKLFNEVLGSHSFNKILNTSNASTSGSLGLITMFKKICNSPSLITNDKTFQKITEHSVIGQHDSGKLQALIELLKEIYKANEKVVIVSNYTQTLDIIQDAVQKLNLNFLRLDGSTPNKDRDSIVNQFNTSNPQTNFSFLLSSKSGGVGLNLIGASRLILFDNDWNPSTDLQAMARIHRDGQKKPVFIYRLITTGCIDEKIFQRQLMKNKLSDKFLDDKSESDDNIFNMNDLKDLFTLQTHTKCNTHDLTGCDCDGKGEEEEDDEEEEEEQDQENVEIGSQNIINNTGFENDEPKIKQEDVGSKIKASGWVSARAIRQKSDDEYSLRKKQIKKVISSFTHIDPVHIHNNASSVTVGDQITETIVSNNRALITYILTKVNKII